MPGDILTAAEVAQIYGVSRQTVARWARDGRLASFRTPGGQLRFHRAEVEHLTEEAPPE